MSFPRYPAYKPSGVEWLPVIPTGWEMSRLKQFCTVFPSNVDKKSVEGEAPVKLCNYTDVYYNDSICAEMEFMDATASEEQIKKFALRAGDVIITKDSETADDIAIAAYVPETLPGVICGYHLSMIRPRGGVSGAYVKRIFDSIYAKSLFAVRANGLTRVGLSQYAVDNVELPLPPSHEQLAIATFLDHETVKIDALIAEQQCLIELLQEKRQAVISHAVTKGLNPDAPMKDSGVEWLGEVPEHWEVTQLRHYSKSIPGFAFPSAQFVEDESQWKLLRGINVGVSCIRWDEVVYWEREDGDQLDQYVLAPGDLVVGLDRPLIKEGLRVARVRPADCPCLLLQRVAAVKGSMELATDYLYYLLSSSFFVAHFEPDTTGVSVPHISTGQIDSFVIPKPPKHEQQQIVSHLSDEILKIKELTIRSTESISLLQERRSALITAAVTGQIDVRGLVPQAEPA